MADRLIAALRHELGHAVSDAPSDLDAFSSNFGSTVKSLARVVVRASEPLALERATRIAADHGVPITIRGLGHSFGTQALSRGGVLLVNECARPEIRLLSDDLVEVPTGTTWGVVERHLNAHGLSVPVLTSEPRVTVGGTLAVGGYGEGTVSVGGQVDLVQRLLLITPERGAIWCSPDENRELFRYSLSSLGQLGVLAKVVLRAVPYERFTRVTVNVHDSMSALLASLRWLEDDRDDGPDSFFAQHYLGRFTSTYGVRLSSVRTASSFVMPDTVRRNSLSTEEGVVEDWPSRCIDFPEERNAGYRVWRDYVFDLDDAYQFARSFLEDAIASSTYLAGNGKVLMLAMRRPQRRRTRFPFEPVVSKSTVACLGFGIYLSVPYDDPTGLEAADSLQQRALQACLALHGRPYLAGAPPLTSASRTALYGDDYTRFLTLRSEMDPHGLFNRSDVL